MPKPSMRLALFPAALLLAAALSAGETPPETAKPAPVSETLSETRHTLTVGGQTIRYRALAGDLLVGEEGKPKARLFYVAYLAEGMGRDRPLTFLFNGGPGSSAVWLHLGAFGPVRVPVDAEGIPGPQPWAPVANPHSLLDVSDLVFVDPVSTGYSRVLPGEKPEPLYGFRTDVESVGEMIRLFVTRQERWGSPLFLAGESYGTIRAAGLADYLGRRHGLALSGVILISPALNTGAFGAPGNDLSYILTLPSFTATAWYHKRLPADLQSDFPRAYREAEEFALGDYALALLRGADLPEAQRRKVVEQLARYTGLPADEIERADLRVVHITFINELLKAEKKVTGLLDARYSGPPSAMPAVAAAPAYSYATIDPSYQVEGVFTATLNRYLREQLKVRSDLPYEVLAQPVGAAWSFDAGHGFLYSGDNLRAAMTLNPRLQVFVASGRYDLVTTPLAARYTISHLGLPEELRGNVVFQEYEGGHMMYLHLPSMEKLKSDLAAFYATAAPAAKPAR